MIYTASKQQTCSLCGKAIPGGHRYWKKGKLTGKQHLNCVDYETPIADAMERKLIDSQLSALRDDLNGCPL